MKIEIVRGAEARQLAEAGSFQADWRARLADERKLALIQGPGFVLPWYRAYADTFEPVLVLGRADSGALEALLPLARRLRDGRLVHAGAEQAEYHGWLAPAGRDEEFLVPALERLRRELGFSTWSWRWLPPGSSADWTVGRALAAEGLHALVERRAAPVWDLEPREHIETHDNRSLRAKRNRYRRRGELRLERVRDAARARELLPRLAAQCDFRQEAVNGVRPFADDPRKAEFFAGRLAFPDDCHFTVLWCGDEALAFHFGGCDGRTCLLGLSSYAPHEGRNSPGTLLLVELARTLAGEGYRRLDLTPGTDAYKQRFATGHEELARVRLFGSRVRRTAVGVLAGARAALVARAGTDERARTERLEQWRRGLGAFRSGLAEGPAALARLGSALLGREELVLFRLDPAASAVPAPPAERVAVQAFAALQAGLAGRSASERRALLAEALARFGDGEVLYTVAEAGKLLRFGWRASGGPLHAALVAAGLGTGEAELLWVSAPLGGSGAEALAECVARMRAESVAAPAAGLFLGVPAPAPAERAALGRLGFRQSGQAERRRGAGRESTWLVRRAAEGAPA